MAYYIETDLTLDSYDLVLLEALLNQRIKEIREFKNSTEASIPRLMADEQLTSLRVTLKKIKEAREQIKAIKAEKDAEFFARTRRERTRSKSTKS